MGYVVNIETVGKSLPSEFIQAWACDMSDQPDAAPQVRVCTELAIPGSARLLPGDIILWTGRATGALCDILARKDNILSPQEIARAKRFLRRDDCETYIAAHFALRKLLAEVLDRDAAAIDFDCGPYGKPEVSGADKKNIHFNVSHAGGLAFIGLSKTRIGVDIECLKPVPNLLQTAGMIFAPEVVNELSRREAEDRTLLFYRHWTLGEAYLKATGHGLNDGMSHFIFSHEGPPVLEYAASSRGQHSWAFGLTGTNSPQT